MKLQLRVLVGVFGALVGRFNVSLMVSAYFSFTTHPSLGLGDSEPLGGIQYLVGLEALTGLVMIT